jgi:hypothetical protein
VKCKRKTRFSFHFQVKSTFDEAKVMACVTFVATDLKGVSEICRNIHGVVARTWSEKEEKSLRAEKIALTLHRRKEQTTS